MKPIIASIAAFAACAALNATAWAGTEMRSVGSFKGVATSGSIDLSITQGDKTSVQVQADDKVLPRVETVVEGDTLQVRIERGARIFYSNGKIKVTIVTPVLTAVSMAGSGDAELNAIRTEQLVVSISGAGDLRGNGQATQLKISIAGSGDVKLREMRADDVKVSIAGSGGAEVDAQKTLNVSIAGSGDVVYSGAAVVKSSVVGSGSVSRK